MKASFHRVLPVIILVGFIFSACSPNYNRFSTDGVQKIKKIKKIGVLTPDVKVVEISAGGSQTPLGKETETAKNLILEKTKKSLEGMGFGVKVINVQDNDSLALQETLAMYRIVDESIQKKKTEETKKKFDFEIGSVDSLAKAYDVDAFLFLTGFDSQASSSRQAAAVAGVVTGILFGVSVALHEPSLISVGLTDKSGKIVFYNMNQETDSPNFTKEKDISELVKTLFKEFSSKVK